VSKHAKAASTSRSMRSNTQLPAQTRSLLREGNWAGRLHTQSLLSSLLPRCFRAY
jgi:hypothetical protein